MGLDMQSIAKLVVELEPKRCPACNALDSFDTAMATPVPGEKSDKEILLVSYHCTRCDTIIHTFGG